MRHLLAILTCVFCPVLAVHGQSGNYEIIQVDPAASTFTAEMNKQLRTFRVRPAVEVTINGVKATFAELEVGMKVQVTSAEPGVATRLAATGIQTKKGAGAAPTGVPVGAEPLRDTVATIPADSADAFLLNDVRKGSKIWLQYAGGKWKSWGNIGTENPDDQKSERGDASRLAIALPSRNAKGGKVLAVVPPETAKRPFVYDVPVDFPVLVLRINDPDSSFEKNPGTVRYAVKVFPPPGK